MTKLVEIENCLLCPHEERTPDGYFCTKMNNRKIESILEIPEWCLLSDIQDNSESYISHLRKELFLIDSMLQEAGIVDDSENEETHLKIIPRVKLAISKLREKDTIKTLDMMNPAFFHNYTVEELKKVLANAIGAFLCIGTSKTRPDFDIGQVKCLSVDGKFEKPIWEDISDKKGNDDDK